MYEVKHILLGLEIVNVLKCLTKLQVFLLIFFK